MLPSPSSSSALGASDTAADVSIVVVAQDRRQELLACLDSIHTHAGALRVQVIVVDNASSDGSPAAVAAAYPPAELVTLAENRGVVARNDGLRRATGRFRLILDSDAFLTEGALPALVEFLERRPEFGLVGPRLVYPDGRLQLSARRFPHPLLPLLRRPPLGRFFERSGPVRHHLMADDTPRRAREVEYVLGACQLFTAEAQARAGEFDPRIFYGPDDIDWCLRIREAGLKIAYEPAAVVVHGYERSSASRPASRLAWSHLRGFAYFQWKWRSARRRLLREGEEMDRRAIPAPARLECAHPCSPGISS